MANTTWYGDGTATVAVGSRTVTGTDTGWLTEVAGLTPIKAGDKFGIHVGRPIVIDQIISDTELLLADDWPGPAQTDAPYKVELTSPTIAAVEAMRRLLASLSNGNLDSLSEISVGTDDIPIGIGPGVFSTINKAALVQGVQYDAWVANLAGRAAYNGAAAGFSVLVIDIGDGRSALYFKNSATSGDWSAPSYVTGPVGPAGVNQRGNYSAGTAYAIRDIVQYGGSTWIAKVATTGNAPPTLPTTENTQWLLFARSGTAGVVDRGTYSGATAYETNDIVLNNGSTWIALQPATGNAPPTLPTESNAYWRLLARKGTDGTGVGDVVGPENAIAGDFVQFSGDTGKEIGTAQMGSPALVGRVSAGVGPVERLTVAQVRAAIGIRDILTENRNYYVRTGGNNANAGTENTDAGAWATLQYAYDFIANKLDLNGFDVTINMADGYHSASLTVAKRLLGNNRVFIRGNVANPANCFLEVTNNNCIVNSCPGFTVNVGGVRFSALNVGSCLFANGGDIQLGANCLFAGALGGDHFIAINGGTISITANYTVAGGCVNHWHAYGFGQVICQNVTITISAPIGVTRWCGVATGLLTSTGCTFTNKANVAGATYLVHRNGCVIVEGAGANYFPGTVAGTAATGGQYV
ncbi:hypothetical protein [Agrobacterium sp. YIC 4121]|uniref:hypothetical protein n=1 Tax=Agrobacterium sp. YIC 4121 TaxID=1923829 RepID=UPI001FD95FBA|nr:hypothetical protein [Agrobacterium sp. YIC 4121]